MSCFSLLVEEEDDGGVHEPLVVADRVEQFHALHHSGKEKRTLQQDKNGAGNILTESFHVTIG
jgi:hypothetical protein